MIDTLSEENKNALVRNIGEMYRDSLKVIQKDGTPKIEEEDGDYLCLNIKEKIDVIIQNLRMEYAIIIQREYLEEKSGNWYEKYFTLNEYNMYKKGAINAFLHCLYG